MEQPMTPEQATFEYDELSKPGFCFLSIRGALTYEALDDFMLHAGLMLSSDRSKLMINISQVPMVRSCFISALVEFQQRASEARKMVTFFVTPPQAARMRRIGVDRVLRLVEVRPRTAETILSELGDAS